MTDLRAALAGPPEVAARALLGAHLAHGDVVVRIVEVEAYGGPEDTASHARFGPAGRSAPMWGAPGLAYVYLCYGVHELLNVVCGPDGVPGALLVRGVEVVAGADVVAARRGGLGPGALAGPGKVTRALDVDRRFDRLDLLGPGPLRLVAGTPPARVVAGPRVGIDFAAPDDRARPWRVADADSAQVSLRRRLG